MTWGRWQVFGAIALASHVTAYLAVQPWSTAYWVLLVATGAILCLAWNRYEMWLAGKRTRAVDELKDRVDRMSLREARDAAHALLRDPAKFRTVAATESPVTYERLPGAVVDLFRVYSSIQAVAGEAQLSRQLIAPSEYQPAFIRIGRNLDCTEIVVRAGDDGVYEVDGSESTREDFDQARSASVYHWIVLTAENLYGN